MQNLADKLKRLRKNQKISQAQLSELLNISQNQVSKYEKGRDVPSVQILFKLSQIFNITIEYLLGLSTDNVLEKVWTQNLTTKRLSLFQKPDGEFAFPYFHDGKEKKSIFTYSFGIFPIENTDFKPTFFVIHEKVGDFLELATGYPNIKKADSNHFIYVYNHTPSIDNLAFTSLINYLNTFLQLGYRLDRESNGMHRVQLITTLPGYGFAEIVSGSGLPVTLKEVIYTKFLSNQYLPLSSEDKSKFLEPYMEEAFKW